jgi:hypothetical protein
MTNPTAQLTELREIRDAMVAKGMPDWWPKYLTYHQPSINPEEDLWVYRGERVGDTCALRPADALTLVVDAGERVLLSMGVGIEYTPAAKDSEARIEHGVSYRAIYRGGAIGRRNLACLIKGDRAEYARVGLAGALRAVMEAEE